jgi:acetyl esterase/lipase
VMGGGDSAGGNMTAAVNLRMRNEGMKPLTTQVLLYPEVRLPFDTDATAENNSGFYLECMSSHTTEHHTNAFPGNDILAFTGHYLPRGISPSYPYISPRMQPKKYSKYFPRAVVFTCGFDPLRNVDVEYGTKLKQAGNQV